MTRATCNSSSTFENLAAEYYSYLSEAEMRVSGSDILENRKKGKIQIARRGGEGEKKKRKDYYFRLQHQNVLKTEVELE